MKINNEYDLLQFITSRANKLIKQALENENELSEMALYQYVQQQTLKIQKEALELVPEVAKKDAQRLYSGYMSDYRRNFSTILLDKDVNLFIRGNALEASLIENSSTMVDTLIRSYRTDYPKQINKLNNLISVGQTTREQALKIVTKDYKGTKVTFSNGVEYPADSYFKSVIKNTQQQEARNVGKRLANDLGTEIYLYSGRTNAKEPRESCSFLEGKLIAFGWSGEIKDGNGDIIQVYDIEEYGYGDPAGPLGINCSHDIFPFIPGVSIL